jgi:RHS repeat-associated protein
MRKTWLAVLAALSVSAGTPRQFESIRAAVAADSALVVRASVRFGRTNRFQTGDVIRILVTRPIEPLGMRTGTVQIRSASTGYDSGVQPLVSEQDGRVRYYQWPTAMLRPARDYHVTASVQTSAGGRETRELDVELRPVVVEESILERTTDLSLPYWSLGLQLTRRFLYESGYGSYRGSFGFGWIHAYGIVMTEDTDSAITLFDTNDGAGRFYRPTKPGQYESPPGDNSRLTRDRDGTFLLRRENGDLWRFRNNLKLDVLQDPRGRRVTLEYDRDERLVAAEDGSGQRIEFEYDGSNRIVRASDRTGRSVSYAYDHLGDLSHYTDAIGGVTSYGYDGDHRLLSITYADGRQRVFTYGSDDRLGSFAFDSGWGALRFDYNLSNPRQGERTITDAMRRETRELSAGDGFLVEQRDAFGASIIRTYDRGFRPQRVTNARVRTWNVLSIVDSGRVTVLDPLGNKTHVLFSFPDGRVSSIVDANTIETRFTFTETGELALVTYADGKVEERTVTEHDRTYIVASKGRGGRNNRYTFDARGQLIRKELSDGSTWSYAYNPQGNLTAATNPTGTIVMEYDAIGRVVTVVYPGARAFRYKYDGQSRRTAMVDPDGDDVSYLFDRGGNVVQIARRGQIIARYEYNLARQPVRRTFANGTTTEYLYDLAGRLRELVHAHGASRISSWTYTLDPDGMRTSKAGLDGTESYAYDDAGRLVSANSDRSAERFEYDPAGNRSSVSVGTAREPITVNRMNQYAALGGLALVYDLDGLLVGASNTRSSWRYQYDPEGRLIRVHLPDSSVVSYTYDALGRLRTRTHRDTTSMFMWDGLRLASEEDTEHRTLRSYTWGARSAEALELREGAARLRYLEDGLGSVTELIDSAGRVVEQYRYHAFGAPVGPALHPNPIRFAGGLYDGATGLYSFLFRWYSPAQGRFIQPDPIGPSGDMNLYTYAANDPVNQTDPLGLTGARGSVQGAWIPFDEPQENVARLIQLGTSVGAGRDGIGLRVARPDESDHRQGIVVVAGDGATIMAAATGPGARTLRLHTTAPAPPGEAIRVPDEALRFIKAHHVTGGALAANQSTFDEMEDIIALVRAAEGVAPVKQATSPNFQRTSDAGRLIGIDATSGRRTSTYVVVTRPNGELVTMYPTLPLSSR